MQFKIERLVSIMRIIILAIASFLFASGALAQQSTTNAPAQVRLSDQPRQLISAPTNPQHQSNPELSLQAESLTASQPEPDQLEKWKLFADRPALEIGGWSQTGYHTLSNGMFNNNPDRIQQHQTWFYAEKVADGSEGIGLGFRIDYLYGTDAPDTQSFGNPPESWDIGWDNGNFYGHAIPQLYGEIASGDVSVKIGHFFTAVGYEVVAAPDNFFYSHAFTMYNAEPFTHTGVLATLDAGDITTYLGWSAGWDTGFDQFGGSTAIVGAALTLTEDTTFTYVATGGRIGNGNDREGYSHSMVLDRNLTDRLNYVFQTDLVDFDSDTVGDRRSIGVNQYLTYQLTDNLAIGSRLEWWQTELEPNNDADLLAYTVGLRYTPCPNTIFRSEVRWNRDNDNFIIPIADNQRTGFGCDFTFLF